ncbi:MAG: family 1 encapsulin nanocompartment shell protein [Stellaceae bacterium]
MTDRLLRDFAPISDAAWELIDAEAQRTVKSILGGRCVVDFRGPGGWQQSAVADGRIDPIAGPGGEIEARRRRVQPLIELRRGFELDRAELEAVERGADDPNLDAAIEAAREIALAEDRAIFHGYAAAAIKGICEGASAPPITLSEDYRAYPQAVATALSHLRDAGVGGPFAIVLGRRCFIGLTETTAGGYPVLQHVRDLIDGPIVRAAAVDGAAVLSMRGGDFELVVGEDFSVGYLSHDANKLRLYIEESMTFRLISPQAAAALVYASGEEGGAGR